MTSDPLPIPEKIWRRIREFLEKGEPGQIVLHVAPGGKVTNADFSVNVRA